MKRITLPVSICVTFGALASLALISLATPGSLAAQAKEQSKPDVAPPLSGVIKMESVETKKTDPYASGQEAAIVWVEELNAALDKRAGGENAAIRTPETGILNHLAGVYLFCSIREGVCPHILQMLLEADFLISLDGGKAQCPALTEFWKVYVTNDFENRHKYMIKTGYLTATSDFKRDVRPRYVRCRETIEEELKKRDAGSLGKRYAAGSPARTSINESLSLLKKLRDSGKNVFAETGAQ